LKDNTKTDRPAVLVCPLSWGLGHASRCIPVVRMLLKKKCVVYIGGSEEVIALMKSEFGKEIGYMKFDGMTMKYGKRTFMNMVLRTPQFIFSSVKEHCKLKKTIRSTGAKAVISDNRYGLWSRKVFTVLITHQLNIRLPSGFSFLQKPLRYIIRKVVRKHNALWVPDNCSGVSFAGDLSKDGEKYHPQFFYTGLLTRFSGFGFDDLGGGRGGPDKRYVLCIVSGPEPQRTFFEKKLLSQLQQIPYDSVLLRGLPGNDKKLENGRCAVYNHTNSKHFAKLIAGAALIVCRPGYSTLMDLSVFGRKALLVPTPGQTEQEYLAGLFNERGWCHSVSQNRLDLKTDIEKALSYVGIPRLPDNKNELSDAADHFLKQLV